MKWAATGTHALRVGSITTVNSSHSPTWPTSASSSSWRLPNRRCDHTRSPRSSHKVATWDARIPRSTPNVALCIASPSGSSIRFDPEGPPDQRITRPSDLTGLRLHRSRIPQQGRHAPRPDRPIWSDRHNTGVEPKARSAAGRGIIRGARIPVAASDGPARRFRAGPGADVAHATRVLSSSFSPSGRQASGSPGTSRRHCCCTRMGIIRPA